MIHYLLHFALLAIALSFYFLYKEKEREKNLLFNEFENYKKGFNKHKIYLKRSMPYPEALGGLFYAERGFKEKVEEKITKIARKNYIIKYLGEDEERRELIFEADFEIIFISPEL